MNNRFLVTGLPRIRSAWLTALFCAHGVRCCHDGLVSFGSLASLESVLKRGAIAGLCDPAAACVFPDEAARWFDGSPIVIVDRDPLECRTSVQAWIGQPVDWSVIQTKHDRFVALIGPRAYRVAYRNLDCEETVRGLFTFCGVTLDYHLFETFKLLRIEQHLVKAQAQFKAA